VKRRLLLLAVASRGLRPGLSLDMAHPYSVPRDPDPFRGPPPGGEASMPGDVVRPSRALGLHVPPVLEDLVITGLGSALCALSELAEPHPGSRCITGLLAPVP
jgi:hypothetical protein